MKALFPNICTILLLYISLFDHANAIFLCIFTILCVTIFVFFIIYFLVLRLNVCTAHMLGKKNIILCFLTNMRYIMDGICTYRIYNKGEYTSVVKKIYKLINQ